MKRLVGQCLFLVAVLLGLAGVFGARHPLPLREAVAAEEPHRPSSPWDKGYSARSSPSSAAFGQPRGDFAQDLSVERDEHGRFHLDGTINGRDAALLVDTGADVVAIPASEAAGFGIPVQPDEFRPILRTASGTALGAPVRITSLTLGNTTLRDVDAVVVQDLDVILLGQSALRRFGRVEIAGDRMVLHPI